ncbi:MAG TPA: hypothetical protein VGB79_16675 [Allosphingosinicella sp.]
MIAKTLILGAALILAAPAAGDAGAAPAEQSPAWDRQLGFALSPSGPAGSGRINLSLRYGEGIRRNNHGRTMALADLEGLSAAGLASAGAPVVFRLAREAGTIDCSGTAQGERRAAGTCRFAPDEAFAADLARRGIGRAEPEQLFHLAVAGVGRPLLDELSRQGYPTPGLSDLVALGIHGADVDYLRGLDAAGYRVGSLDNLVAFRIHGVTPAYISELAALGVPFRSMSPDDLVGMRIHGVRPEQARELAALGYRDLSAETLTAFAMHRVTPAYVREMAEAGYPNLTAQQLLSLRINNVRADDARALNEAVAGATR